ncbi:MAG: HAD family phosphatase [Clostridiaceae bacterium]|nr:HAD family phosphatase [Clostridiaceae bacterium]
MVRLVISDVDGTILDETEHIPERIADLEKLIQKKKILFTIASGREYSQVRELEELLKIQIPVILCNGTAARSGDDFSWCESIPPDIVETIVDSADGYGMSVILSLPDKECVVRKTSFVEQTIEQYGRFGEILDLNGKGWPSVSVQKILIIERNNPRAYEKMLEILRRYESQITFVDFGGSIDIVPKGCTKASGVRKLSEKLGIDLAEVMALGDSYNDLEMLEIVGLGVAVNNAVDQLKSRADYICCEKYVDGVIEAIEKFC